MKKIFFLIFILLLSFNEIYSQRNSIYSSYGIGDLEYSSSARHSGMGDLGIVLNEKDFISSLNPASLNSLNLTRVDFSLYYDGNFSKSNSQSNFFSGVYFNGFNLAFPISKKNGIVSSLGIVPFSKIRYEIAENGIDPTTNESYLGSYKGEGGLYNAYLGTSYKFPFGMAIGASVNYYFGNLIYTSNLQYENSLLFGTEYEKKYKVDGFGGTFGLISQDFSTLFNTKKVKDIKLGVVFNYISELNTDSVLSRRTSFLNDTLYEGTTKMKLPYRIIVGLGMNYNEKYQIYLDYLYQPWEDYKLNDNADPNLKNLSKISFGLEYQKEKGNSFRELIVWRLGLSYESSQFKINNENINRYMISSGISIPLGRSNSLDLSLQYSMRGKTDANLIKENLLKLNVGINFGDIWFIRRER